MSQRHRSSRGHNRNQGAGHGEEAQLWESAKEKFSELVASINADNENLANLIDVDRSVAHARTHAIDPHLPITELARLEGLCQSGVRLSKANSSRIKSLIEQLTVLRGVQFAKESAAEAGPHLAGPVVSVNSASSGNNNGNNDNSDNNKTIAISSSSNSNTAAIVPTVAIASPGPTPATTTATTSGRAAGTRNARERERERDRDGQTAAVPHDIDAAANESSIPSPIPSLSRGRTGSARDRHDSASVKIENTVGEPPQGSTASSVAGSAAAAAATHSTAASAVPTAATTAPAAVGSGVAAAASTASTTGDTGTGTPAAPMPAPAAPGPSNLRGRITFARGDEVAFRPKAEQTSDWILGEVAQVLGEGKSRRYKVLDVEPEDPAKQKEYRSSASSMIAITPEGPSADALLPWEPGKVVLALYPQTTTFYKAEVVGTAPDGRVELRFEGENDSRTILQVERRFVIENRFSTRHLERSFPGLSPNGS